MRRIIISGDSSPASAPGRLPPGPEKVFFPLSGSVNRCAVSGVVKVDDTVLEGQPVAEGELLTIHSSVSGKIEKADEDGITVSPVPPGEKQGLELGIPSSRQELPAYAASIGLVGMGGSMFPYSVKFKACDTVETLVVNCVECEPHIEIDEALLLHEKEAVVAGVRFLEEILGLKETVVAAQAQKIAHIRAQLSGCGFSWLPVRNRYPGGAERLIVKKLSGIMPAAGVLPMKLGYLVMSVASLWALGRSILEKVPCTERPLTVFCGSGTTHNLIVPVGISAEAAIKNCADFNPATHTVISGGMMMGTAVPPGFPILKGTNALIIKETDSRLRNEESPCTLCGACFDCCPLGLHPSSMAVRLRGEEYSESLRAHLDECFLCGACTAACPADIQLAQCFREGKEWLRNQS